MASVKLFAQLREIAGVSSLNIEGATVAEVVEMVATMFGSDFIQLLPSCKVWIDGEPSDGTEVVKTDSEIAILPPVSGG